jgi:hypothetical protein
MNISWRYFLFYDVAACFSFTTVAALGGWVVGGGRVLPGSHLLTNEMEGKLSNSKEQSYHS